MAASRSRDPPLIAPVRALIDCALYDFVARREHLSVAAWLGGTAEKVIRKTNQTLFWSSFEQFLAQVEIENLKGHFSGFDF